MKCSFINKDLIALAMLSLILGTFLTPWGRMIYEGLYQSFPLLICFIKFALLSTGGEILAQRIRRGNYTLKGFGLLPKMLIWGILGIFIYAAMGIFSKGVPEFIPQIQGEGWIFRISSAFLISFFMNLIFAPPMMLTHLITDYHIQLNKGTFPFKGLRVEQILQGIPWNTFWRIHISKLIPFFWIPAHTITFLLPENYRTLTAALLSIVLGLFMALFQGKKNERSIA